MAQSVPGSLKKYFNGQFMKNMDGGRKMNSLKGVWRQAKIAPTLLSFTRQTPENANDTYKSNETIISGGGEDEPENDLFVSIDIMIS